MVPDPAGWSLRDNIGRLQRGATIQQVQAQIDALNASNLEKFPQFKELLVKAGFYTSVDQLQEMVVRGVRSVLHRLWAGSVFVLLIGVLNIANLSFARLTLRRKEFATRIAGRGCVDLSGLRNIRRSGSLKGDYDRSDRFLIVHVILTLSSLCRHRQVHSLRIAASASASASSTSAAGTGTTSATAGDHSNHNHDGNQSQDRSCFAPNEQQRHWY
jgi:hypothetical protein